MVSPKVYLWLRKFLSWFSGYACMVPWSAVSLARVSFANCTDGRVTLAYIIYSSLFRIGCLRHTFIRKREIGLREHNRKLSSRLLAGSKNWQSENGHSEPSPADCKFCPANWMAILGGFTTLFINDDIDFSSSHTLHYYMHTRRRRYMHINTCTLQCSVRTIQAKIVQP